MLNLSAAVSRRGILQSGALAMAGLCASRALAAGPSTLLVRPSLLHRALLSRDRHSRRLQHHDTIGIADFDAASSERRFHIVDVPSGRSTSYLVAHGRGSDPDHTGWLERFSNVDGSEASSSGAFVTADIYDGMHGRSRRLIGLDPTNCNAESRAIVVHSAWYVSPDVVRDHGKLGRSEGCFAVSEGDLDQVLSRLSAGHLIYADKV